LETTPDTIEKLIREGYREEDIEATVPEFVDYWTSDAPADPFKRDWQQTFRNRMRSAPGRGPAKPQFGRSANPAQTSLTDAFLGQIDRIKRSA
jgi:hypothetical protein